MLVFFFLLGGHWFFDNQVVINFPSNVAKVPRCVFLSVIKRHNGYVESMHSGFLREDCNELDYLVFLSMLLLWLEKRL